MLKGIKNICSILTGIALIWFAWQKLSDPVGFLKAIHTYEILPTQPQQWLNLSATWIPWLELCTGLCILFNYLRRPAAMLSSVMLMIFTIAVFARGLDIHGLGELNFCEIAFDCGCGTGVVNICTKLIENFLLIAACIWISLPDYFSTTGE